MSQSLMSYPGSSQNQDIFGNDRVMKRYLERKQQQEARVKQKANEIRLFSPSIDTEFKKNDSIEGMTSATNKTTTAKSQMRANLQFYQSRQGRSNFQQTQPHFSASVGPIVKVNQNNLTTVGDELYSPSLCDTE